MADGTLTRVLAERTGTNAADWFPVFKARYGMAVVFRELANRQGRGAVATQAFTCATAIDPILVGGLRPAYADISPHTISLDPTRLTLPPDLRALVIQHTFGIVSEADSVALAAVARAAGALVLEDSAHCVARLARTDAGAPLADVSVHSFGVEKMLPTRFGGAIWLNPEFADQELRAHLAGTLAGLPRVPVRLTAKARAFRTQVRVLNRLGPLARPTRTALGALGLHEPAIAPAELRGRLPYGPMRPSPWIERQAVVALSELEEIEARRRTAVGQYLAALGSVEFPGGVDYPAAISADQALVLFPLFAADQPTAEALIAHLTANGVYATRWYRPALYPGVNDPVYGLRPDDPGLPVTIDLTSRVLNLPTNLLAPQDAARIGSLVGEFLRANG